MGMVTTANIHISNIKNENGSMQIIYTKHQSKDNLQAGGKYSSTQHEEHYHKYLQTQTGENTTFMHHACCTALHQQQQQQWSVVSGCGHEAACGKHHSTPQAATVPDLAKAGNHASNIYEFIWKFFWGWS